MNHRRTIAKAIPPLLGVGLVLAACATVPDYGVAAYPDAHNGYYTGDEGYPYDPLYGSFGFDRFHHDREFGHGHGFAQHAGHGFGRFGGHGFAGNFGHGFGGHSGFGGHGRG